MIDDPEAFFNLATDTVELQNSGIRKTEAAELLESFV